MNDADLMKQITTLKIHLRALMEETALLRRYMEENAKGFEDWLQADAARMDRLRISRGESIKSFGENPDDWE